jgi:hypothetical protein
VTLYGWKLVASWPEWDVVIVGALMAVAGTLAGWVYGATTRS